MSELMIYWLYRGSKPLTAVRLPPGATDEQVIAEAVSWHQRVPTCYPELPYVWESYLRQAEVKRS